MQRSSKDKSYDLESLVNQYIDIDRKRNKSDSDYTKLKELNKQIATNATLILQNNQHKHIYDLKNFGPVNTWQFIFGEAMPIEMNSDLIKIAYKELIKLINKNTKERQDQLFKSASLLSISEDDEFDNNQVEQNHTIEKEIDKPFFEKPQLSPLQPERKNFWDTYYNDETYQEDALTMQTAGAVIGAIVTGGLVIAFGIMTGGFGVFIGILAAFVAAAVGAIPGAALGYLGGLALSAVRYFTEDNAAAPQNPNIVSVDVIKKDVLESHSNESGKGNADKSYNKMYQTLGLPQPVEPDPNRTITTTVLDADSSKEALPVEPAPTHGEFKAKKRG